MKPYDVYRNDVQQDMLRTESRMCFRRGVAFEEK